MKADRQIRTALLLGERKSLSLQEKHVLVVGVGGVGGMALTMLARAGIEHFTIVDGDIVNASNINRQIIAFDDNIGQSKVEVAKEMVLRINPEAKIHPIQKFLTETDIPILFDEGVHYDFVLDCIDTVVPKCSLLFFCKKQNIPIISSMGAGAKKDPTRIKIADISKTSYCSLARVVRRKLSSMGIKKGIATVFSSESPIQEAVLRESIDPLKKTTVGTISYLPNIFGCYMAAYVIERI